MPETNDIDMDEYIGEDTVDWADSALQAIALTSGVVAPENPMITLAACRVFCRQAADGLERAQAEHAGDPQTSKNVADNTALLDELTERLYARCEARRMERIQ